MSACLLSFALLIAPQIGSRQAHPAIEPASFGTRLALVGDLDGDGWSEVAMTAPRHAAERGRVTVASPRTGDVCIDVVGRESGEGLGEALWTHVDVDGDGWNDVVVSVKPREDGVRRRAVRALSGRDGRELFTLLVPLVSPHEFVFGAANVWIADRDGDGCAEVCAYDPRTGTIVSRRAGGELRFPGGPALATRDGCFFAHSLAELGRDADGDGMEDLAYAETVASVRNVNLTTAEMDTMDAGYEPDDVTIVAARGEGNRDVPTHAYRTVYETTRKLRIVSGADGATLREIDVLADGEFGRALRVVPDFDGDGIDEVGVTTWRTARFPNVACELLFSGRDLTPLDLPGAHVVLGCNGRSSEIVADEIVFPTRLVYDRDLDGDGRCELLIGDGHRVRVLRGDGAELLVLTAPAPKPTRDPYALGRPSLNRAGRP